MVPYVTASETSSQVSMDIAWREEWGWRQHGLIEGCSLEERFGVFLGLMRGVGIFVNSLEKLASNPSCLELVDGWP